ncbi:MAG: hypothetical protein IV090_08710 [Candidatus Sericytochromatia bacterium]|nr:hypothetical protein [Candidatus Sericytochromatia bacterium]
MQDLAVHLATGLCIGISLTLCGLILWSLKALGVSSRAQTWTGIGLVGWLLLTAGLAQSGVLNHFSSTPPRMFAVVMPALFFCLILTFHPRLQTLWQQVPTTWLLGFQTFRIGVELFLWLLFTSAIVPVQMTFEGRNWDILTGLTAPLMVWLWVQQPQARRSLVLIWNLAGLTLLLNIVGISILSMPTAFQVFTQAPSNTFVASFPFVWLPSFLVPLALLGHCLSLRQSALQARFKSPQHVV